MFGFGVYVGDRVCDVGGRTNPSITLDNGKQVWGYECWWGPEDEIQRMIGDRKVVFVERESDKTTFVIEPDVSKEQLEQAIERARKNE